MEMKVQRLHLGHSEMSGMINYKKKIMTMKNAIFKEPKYVIKIVASELCFAIRFV